MVTPEQIDAWARGIGLPRCVGEEFVAQYSRLPQSIPELENWGNSTGRRNPSTGVWTCKGIIAVPPTPPPPPATTPPPAATPSGNGTNGGTGPGTGFDPIAWVKANPIPAAIIAFLLLRR